MKNRKRRLMKARVKEFMKKKTLTGDARAEPEMKHDVAVGSEKNGNSSLADENGSRPHNNRKPESKSKTVTDRNEGMVEGSSNIMASKKHAFNTGSRNITEKEKLLRNKWKKNAVKRHYKSTASGSGSVSEGFTGNGDNNDFTAISDQLVTGEIYGSNPIHDVTEASNNRRKTLKRSDKKYDKESNKKTDQKPDKKSDKKHISYKWDIAGTGKSAREKERLKQKRRRIVSRRRMRDKFKPVLDSNKWFTPEYMNESDTGSDDIGKDEILFTKGAAEAGSGFVKDGIRTAKEYISEAEAGVSGLSRKHRKRLSKVFKLKDNSSEQLVKPDHDEIFFNNNYEINFKQANEKGTNTDTSGILTRSGRKKRLYKQDSGYESPGRYWKGERSGKAEEYGIEGSKVSNASDSYIQGNPKDYGLNDRKSAKNSEYSKDQRGIRRYFHSDSGFEDRRHVNTDKPDYDQTKYFCRRETRRIKSSRRTRKAAEKTASAIRAEDELIELDRKKRYRKALQKMKIRREYANAIRKGEEAKQAADYAKKATERTKSIASKTIEMVRKHAGIAAVALAFVFMFMVISTCISSCGSMFGGGSSVIMGGSYDSLPSDIDGVESALSSLEAQLRNRVKNIKTEYPGYDEYNINVSGIEHNPFSLVSYLSAEHGIFTASDCQDEIEDLFKEMYDLVITPTQETRSRSVTTWTTTTDPETGETTSTPTTTIEYYTVNILSVSLKKKTLETIAEEKFAGNQDAKDLYEAYQVTKGALQEYYSPLESDWYGSVIKNFGSYEDSSGNEQYHNGIDISVSPGTDILAAQDGVITMASYDSHYGGYVEITGITGYVSRYGHLQTMNVEVGQTVLHGDVIGKSGHTLEGTVCHLHLECIFEGEYYNPLFYFESGL